MNNSFNIVVFCLFICSSSYSFYGGNDIKSLKEYTKSKDLYTKFNSIAELAAYFRTNDELKKAEKLLNKFKSPRGFDKLPKKLTIPYLRCLLEAAHLRALNNDVKGSLQLLNWAVNRKNDYENVLSSLKYAEILIELDESERAKAYLGEADIIISNHLRGNSHMGAAIGQGINSVATKTSWIEQRNFSDYLSSELEEINLSKKFGATYGLYVKLRRLQRLVKRSRSPRYFNKAMQLCDEIVETDPECDFLNSPAEIVIEICLKEIRRYVLVS